MPKIVYNAGHTLYAHNLAEAAKFNTSSLHRRSPKPPARPVAFLLYASWISAARLVLSV